MSSYISPLDFINFVKPPRPPSTRGQITVYDSKDAAKHELWVLFMLEGKDNYNINIPLPANDQYDDSNIVWGMESNSGKRILWQHIGNIIQGVPPNRPFMYIMETIDSDQNTPNVHNWQATINYVGGSEPDYAYNDQYYRWQINPSSGPAPNTFDFMAEPPPSPKQLKSVHTQTVANLQSSNFVDRYRFSIPDDGLERRQSEEGAGHQDGGRVGSGILDHSDASEGETIHADQRQDGAAQSSPVRNKRHGEVLEGQKRPKPSNSRYRM